MAKATRVDKKKNEKVKPIKTRQDFVKIKSVKQKEKKKQIEKDIEEKEKYLASVNENGSSSSTIKQLPKKLKQKVKIKIKTRKITNKEIKNRIKKQIIEEDELKSRHLFPFALTPLEQKKFQHSKNTCIFKHHIITDF